MPSFERVVAAEQAPLTDGLWPHEPRLTPAGIQPRAQVKARRRIAMTLVAATYAGLAAAMALVLGQGGWTPIDILMFAAFLVAAPWTVVGFWNAAIGLWLLHGRRDGLNMVAPFIDAAKDASALDERTAVVMTLRNEDASRAISRLRIVQRSLDATGEGHMFAFFVLSDTSDPAVASAEEREVATWQREAGFERIVYRRRAENAGFKAGNVADFCARWGERFTYMLPLDADSLMDGETIVSMARMMRAHPRLGILQSLVVGLPSSSAFARIFQFGMRQGMRPYTLGASWWAADCGPFWGHNAMVRIAPFIAHCRLPVLPPGPLGGAILSHDQVEAVLMRRAGYEVRVWPQEVGSFEDNPPTLSDFSRREMRWCQGNLQYLRLLHWPGLEPMSRFQLVWAILMFLGVPAFAVMIGLTPLKVLEVDAAGTHVVGAVTLYLTFLFMYLSPKLAGISDILLRRETHRYGGTVKFLAGAALEIAVSFLTGAATTFRMTLFMFGLVLGQRARWNGQVRDAHRVSWGQASREHGPALVFGLAVMAMMAWASPFVLAWSLPLTLGYLLAIPFTVLTSLPQAGAWMERRHLCAVPEELVPPPVVAALRSTGERAAEPAANEAA